MTPQASMPREQAIRSRIDEFVNAWNKHDARGMSTVFADDADMIDPYGRIAKSKAEIEKMLRDEHSNAFKDSRITLRSSGLKFLSQDVAVGNYEFEVTRARDRAGKETTLQGHLTDVFKKQGDTWVVEACRPTVPLPS